FFQAEDGIRGYKVTGVQTCALPIYEGNCEIAAGAVATEGDAISRDALPAQETPCRHRIVVCRGIRVLRRQSEADSQGAHARGARSEERRVGKGGRYRWPTARRTNNA